MDAELVAFLDQRFSAFGQQIVGALSQQITALREETAVRFERLELRFDRLEQRVEALEARIQGLEARMGNLEARVEGLDERSRQTLVMLEGIRHEVHLIAEGFVGLNDRVDRFQSEATLVFDQVRGWIEPYYKSLDGRLKVLEGQAERRHLSALDQVKLLLAPGGALAPRPAE
jgi:chromosome segregation ATPase